MPSFLPVASVVPHRILIVEDEGIIANALAARLVNLGYEVAGIAESSEMAITKTSGLSPDVILMDIRIKGAMDGIETAEVVRKRFDIPLIYLTAHSDPQTFDRAKRSGASGFLTKPFDQANLIFSIEMTIHRHRADRIQQKAWEATVRTQNHYRAQAEIAGQTSSAVGRSRLFRNF
jgi:two-component system, response regulator PdtaR